MIGTGSGSCLTAGISIGGVETPSSATVVLVNVLTDTNHNRSLPRDCCVTTSVPVALCYR
jgi:hypothetical protein